MRKISFILTFISIVSTAFAQENLIEDGKFEKASFNVSGKSKKVAGKGEWYPYLTGENAIVSVVNDKEKGKAVMFQPLSDLSYAYYYVAQQIKGEVKPGTYRLGIWAKSMHDNPLPVLNVYLRINDASQEYLFFKLADFNPKENPNRSGALFQRRLTNEWKYYTVDFDLSQTINSGSNYKLSTEKGNNIVMKKASEQDLTNFFVGIASTSSRNTQFLFADVSLIKIN